MQGSSSGQCRVLQSSTVYIRGVRVPSPACNLCSESARPPKDAYREWTCNQPEPAALLASSPITAVHNRGLRLKTFKVKHDRCYHPGPDLETTLSLLRSIMHRVVQLRSLFFFKLTDYRASKHGLPCASIASIAMHLGLPSYSTPLNTTRCKVSSSFQFHTAILYHSGLALLLLCTCTIPT